MKRTINIRIILALGLGLTLAALCLSLNPGSALSKAPADELHVCPIGCPYSSVQAAVDAANEGDIIKVATGVYTDVNTYGGLKQIVYITKTVTIQGGYTATVDGWATPYPITQPTILDAQGRGRALYIKGNISPAIESMRITGGDAAGLGGGLWPGYDAGGGAYIFVAATIISDCQVYSNTAIYGGGMYLRNNIATLQNNIFVSNTSANFGGGLFFDHSNSIFSRNTVAFNSSHYGGGVFLWWVSNAAIDGNTFNNNHASTGGGGLSLYYTGLWHIKLDTGATLRQSWVTTTPTSPGGTLCYRLLSINLFNWSSSLRLWDSRSSRLLYNTLPT